MLLMPELSLEKQDELFEISDLSDESSKFELITGGSRGGRSGRNKMTRGDGKEFNRL